MDILCVGQMVTDILVKPVEGIDFEIDTKRVDRINMKNGGDCLNTAIDLAILGNKVGMVGLLGDDNFGEYLLSTIKKYGIDIRGLKVLSEVSTSAVIVLINENGERTFLYFGGSNDLFSYDHIDINLIDECEIVHVGGTYLMPKFDGYGASKLFENAHKKGKLTSMDVTWDTTGRWIEVIKPCLKHLDFFMPSYNEAKEITGENDPEKISDLLLMEGVKNVVLKLGKEGCFVRGPNEKFYLKAYDVDVIDTTGAGDAFVAGFLTGLAKKWDLKDCAEFASAVSAHCIGQLGATTGIPSFERTVEFVKNNR